MVKLCYSFSCKWHYAAGALCRCFITCFTGRVTLLAVCIRSVTVVTILAFIDAGVAVKERKVRVTTVAGSAGGATIICTRLALVIAWNTLVGLLVGAFWTVIIAFVFI